MRSMTGYGYASHSESRFQLEVEVKGYNNRYLEIFTNIHSALSSFEPLVVQYVKETARRGKVEISVRLKVFQSDSLVHVDSSLLDSYLAAIGEVEKTRKLALPINLESLLSIEGLFTAASQLDAEEYRSALEECLSHALADFEASRKREGEETKKDLLRLGTSFKTAMEAIGAKASGYEDYFRSLLLERYRELELSDRFDEAKMMQEVGLLLVKYSINEEQKRLETHVKEYFRLLETDEPVGKKLDFLCQEMNREVNTTASKSQNVDITLYTVQMKDDLENIREQIRNIE